ncbi:uncharacterized protein EDB91DRAFT_1086313 [Suillus paluster]|uniref:uncharacterized protein n=1 Tax=Suillus paluster TaxID=48578 RepID=UPI001B86DA73|nr:uncharacterized protein EDB91DRAFT_1086313 [Suillus paluster]KAG1727645.1 hypothetical protein EDB91DRAFT_1086313 [Suillus paluster]
MALYWAIVNNLREALSAFTKHISKYNCTFDLRLACMIASDHALFTQLNLRRIINHEIEVSEGDGLGENQFVASFRFKLFQKHLRITQDLAVEFVAGGRMWVLHFYLNVDEILPRTYMGIEPSKAVTTVWGSLGSWPIYEWQHHICRLGWHFTCKTGDGGKVA